MLQMMRRRQKKAQKQAAKKKAGFAALSLLRSPPLSLHCLPYLSVSVSLWLWRTQPLSLAPALSLCGSYQLCGS